MKKLNKKQIIRTVLGAKVTNGSYPPEFDALAEDDLDAVFKIEDDPYETVEKLRKTLPNRPSLQDGSVIK